MISVNVIKKNIQLSSLSVQYILGFATAVQILKSPGEKFQVLNLLDFTISGELDSMRQIKLGFMSPA